MKVLHVCPKFLTTIDTLQPLKTVEANIQLSLASLAFHLALILKDILSLTESRDARKMTPSQECTDNIRERLQIFLSFLQCHPSK